MRIYVLTRGRIQKQVTRQYAFLDKISEIWPVTYVISECEITEYLLFYPNTHYLIIPDDYTSGEIRQYIAEQFFINYDPFQIHLDDDMYMFRRKERAPLLDKANLRDMLSLFTFIERILKEQNYKHGGVSAREGNNRIEEDLKYNSRAMRFLFYDIRSVLDNGIKFTDVMCRMDFHVTLSLLERGYPNIVIYEWAQNQVGSATKGGADHYRTAEMMNEQTKELYRLHPNFVRIEDKKTKTSFGGGWRKDVRIFWKKAFESSQK